MNKTILFTRITFLLKYKKRNSHPQKGAVNDKETAGGRKKSAIFATLANDAEND